MLERLARHSTSASPALAATICQFRALIDIERGRPGFGPSPSSTATPSSGDRAGAKPKGSARGSWTRFAPSFSAALPPSRSGDLARAKEHLGGARRRSRCARIPREKWWYHLLLGELALASGDPRAAYASFTQGEPHAQASVQRHEAPLENLGGSLSFRDGAARSKAIAGDRRRRSRSTVSFFVPTSATNGPRSWSRASTSSSRVSRGRKADDAEALQALSGLSRSSGRTPIEAYPRSSRPGGISASTS